MNVKRRICPDENKGIAHGDLEHAFRLYFQRSPRHATIPLPLSMEALRAKYGLPAVPPPPGELMEEEVVWRDRQEWLEGLGYRLRPRYRKDWVPSWGDNFDGGAEDSVSLMVSSSSASTLANPDFRIF